MSESFLSHYFVFGIQNVLSNQNQNHNQNQNPEQNQCNHLVSICVSETVTLNRKVVSVTEHLEILRKTGTLHSTHVNLNFKNSFFIDKYV